MFGLGLNSFSRSYPVVSMYLEMGCGSRSAARNILIKRGRWENVEPISSHEVSNGKCVGPNEENDEGWYWVKGNGCDQCRYGLMQFWHSVGVGLKRAIRSKWKDGVFRSDRSSLKGRLVLKGG